MLQQHYVNTIKQKSAFATLFSVIIMGMISLSLVASMLLISIDSGKVDEAQRSGTSALALAHACAEIALNKLKLDNTYTGNEIVTLGSNTCQILTISGNGNTNRVIQTSGTVGSGTAGTYTLKLEVSVTTVNPTTVINYWQQKAF